MRGAALPRWRTSVDLGHKRSAGEGEGAAHAETDDGHLTRAGGLEVLHGTLDVLQARINGKWCANKANAKLLMSYLNRGGPVQTVHQMTGVLVVDSALAAVPEVMTTMIENDNEPLVTVPSVCAKEEKKGVVQVGNERAESLVGHILGHIDDLTRPRHAQHERRDETSIVSAHRAKERLVRRVGPYLVVDAPPLLDHNHTDAQIVCTDVT